MRNGMTLTTGDTMTNEAKLLDILRQGKNLNKFCRDFYEIVYKTDCKKTGKTPISFKLYKTLNRKALSTLWKKGLPNVKKQAENKPVNQK